MTYVLGLTGGIATGKSAVSAIFKAEQIPVVDADKIAHEIVAPKTSGLANVVKHFGSDILNSDGSLNRKKLGSIVFTDPVKRKLLDRINGQLIRQEIIRQTQGWQAKQAALVVLDIPLLFEYPYPILTDGIMVVYVPESIQLKRLMARNHYTKTEAQKRMHSQIDIETKKQQADFVIDNQGSLTDLKKQVLNFLKTKPYLHKN